MCKLLYYLLFVLSNVNLLPKQSLDEFKEIIRMLSLLHFHAYESTLARPLISLLPMILAVWLRVDSYFSNAATVSLFYLNLMKNVLLFYLAFP